MPQQRGSAASLEENSGCWGPCRAGVHLTGFRADASACARGCPVDTLPSGLLTSAQLPVVIPAFPGAWCVFPLGSCLSTISTCCTILCQEGSIIKATNGSWMQGQRVPTLDTGAEQAGAGSLNLESLDALLSNEQLLASSQFP